MARVRCCCFSTVNCTSFVRYLLAHLPVCLLIVDPLGGCLRGHTQQVLSELSDMRIVVDETRATVFEQAKEHAQVSVGLLYA